MRRCPACKHWWLLRPRWYQLWRWPMYWSRCPFLDYADRPIRLNDPLIQILMDRYRD